MLPIELSPEVQPRNKIGQWCVTKMFPEWGNYQSICTNPEVFSRYVTDNPLIVVHPGYTRYGHISDRFYNTKPSSYDNYLQSLRKAVEQALAENRSVFFYIPGSRKNETWEIMQPLQTVICIPTMEDFDMTRPFKPLVLRTRQSFIKLLARYVSQAELCGEYGHGCVLALADHLADYMKIVIREECTYPPDYKKTYPVQLLQEIGRTKRSLGKKIEFCIECGYVLPKTRNGLRNLIDSFS